ncbi:MAG: hypothetical protein WCC30_09535 [Candidatus Dormiibacterota bacterium]
MTRSGLWAVRGGIALGVLLLRLPTLSEPAWYSDDGFFMSVAWLTTQGLRLYSGVYDNSPPAIYWLYRLMLALGAGQHHVVVQAFAAVAVIASSLLTFEVARRIAPMWPAALAGSLTGLALSLPVLDGDLFNVELAGLPFFLVALLLAFHRAPFAAAASGAMLCMAVAFRPSYAVDGLTILMVLVTAGRPVARVAAAAAGIAAVAAAVAISLWAEGSLAPYVNTVLPSDHAYLVWANGGSLVPLYLRLAVLGVAAIAGLAASRTIQGRVLAVWIPAAVAGASLAPRELTHYVHEAIPALAVGMSLLAVRLRWRPLAASVAALGLVAAAEAGLVLPAQETALVQGVGAPAPFLHNYAYAALPAFYANWFAFMTGEKSSSAYDAWFPGQGGKDAAELERLRRAAGPGPIRIVVVGDRPWLYVKGGVLPATPFIATNSSFWRVPSAPADITRTIAGACAEFVIDIDVNADWTRELNTAAYVPVQGAPWPTFKSVTQSPSC